MTGLEQLITIDPYWASVLTTACIMAIAAIGLQITLASGQFSIIHAALMGLGAYAAGYTAELLAWPLLVSLLTGVIVGGTVGCAVSLLVSRLRGFYLGIATLALGQAIVIIAQEFFPGRALGFSGVPIDVDLWLPSLLLIGILLALRQVRQSRSMMALLAVGSDHVATTSLGISNLKIKLWSFAIGGGLAGLAGALNVHYLGLVVPNDLGFGAETQLLIFVIVGGIETPFGAAFGAVAIIVGLELLRVAPLDRYWLLGLLFVLAVLLRPRGLFVRWPLGWGVSFDARRLLPVWTRLRTAPDPSQLEPEVDRDRVEDKS